MNGMKRVIVGDIRKNSAKRKKKKEKRKKKRKKNINAR
jgi:hypothetical protein